MVHRRSLDGTELVFGNQGDLWGNAMTWWDHDTGSVWSQPLGEAILGPRKGARLELLASTLTEWGPWRTAHPDTLALNAPGGSSGFSLDELTIVVELAGEAVAYPVQDLRETGVANDVVADLEIAVVIDPNDRERWTVFARRVGEQILDLSVIDGELTDQQTGTVWDPLRGIGLNGPLAGEVLALLPGFTSFERDFHTFWPDGRVWSSSEP